MGVLKYVSRKFSLKKQFVLFFIIGVVISASVSFVFMTFSLTITHNLKTLLSFESFVDANINQIEQPSIKSVLIQEAENAKANYWILDKNKNVVYSTLKQGVPHQISIGVQKYQQRLDIDGEKDIYSYKPLIEDGKFKGAMIVRYKYFFLYNSLIYHLMENTSYDAVINLFLILPVILLSPIITLLVLSRMFAKSLNLPLQEIIAASDHIRKQELDFVIDTSYKNEIGSALEAVENMRSALDDSLKKQWKMTEERKDMILALVHDIKTPITVICGHLELLTGSYPNISEEDRIKYLKILQNNSDKVRTLINELNEVWDLERPEFTLQKKEVILSDYLSDIDDKFTWICKENDISFTISHEFAQDVSCYFDPFRMEEVIDNIISNALKHTSQGGNIALQAYKEMQWLKIKISDSGKGFSESDTENLFSKFYKGTNENSEKNSSGLGLYICRLIIEKHEGTIIAYNGKTGGAVLEMTLPDKR